MGAEVFICEAKGKGAEDAFSNACSEAAYEYGHGGYTGSIAEKDSFVLIECPANVDPADFAEQLVDEDDDRIDDKWGPAGCIDLGNDSYLFFGWASS